jgi:hypothetical protein
MPRPSLCARVSAAELMPVSASGVSPERESGVSFREPYGRPVPLEKREALVMAADIKASPGNEVAQLWLPGVE